MNVSLAQLMMEDIDASVFLQTALILIVTDVTLVIQTYVLTATPTLIKVAMTAHVMIGIPKTLTTV